MKFSELYEKIIYDLTDKEDKVFYQSKEVPSLKSKKWRKKFKPAFKFNESDENTIWYHGSSVKISQFYLDFVGKGYDQEGPGIYLTSDKEDALHYTSKDNNEVGYVYTVQVDPENLINVSSRPNKNKIITLIQMAKNVDKDYYELNLSNYDENPSVAFKQVVDNILDEYDENPFSAAFQSVWWEFYKKYPKEFCENMGKIGYDGVLIERRNGVKHAIIYNLDKIKVLEIKDINNN